MWYIVYSRALNGFFFFYRLLAISIIYGVPGLYRVGKLTHKEKGFILILDFRGSGPRSSGPIGLKPLWDAAEQLLSSQPGNKKA